MKNKDYISRKFFWKEFFAKLIPIPQTFIVFGPTICSTNLGYAYKELTLRNASLN